MLTARDPGAAAHILEIARHLEGEGPYCISVAAGEPALSFLKARGIPAIPFVANTTIDQLPSHRSDLLRQAKAVLREVNPWAVLTGLSSPGAVGVDEAVHAARGDIPGLTFQDFWGEVNTGLGVLPDRLLVLDSVARRWSEVLHGVPASEVGSPKHQSYTALQPEILRREARQALGMLPADRLIGWFGQALWPLAGYRITMRNIVNEVTKQMPDARVLYRPHPRESTAMVDATFRLLREHGVQVADTRLLPYVSQLCACDIVASAFSTCGLDLAYLQQISSEPLGVPLYLFHEPDVRDVSPVLSRFKALPLTECGCSLEVENAEALPARFADALQEATRTSIWEHCFELPRPNHAIKRIAAVLNEL